MKVEGDTHFSLSIINMIHYIYNNNNNYYSILFLQCPGWFVVLLFQQIMRNCDVGGDPEEFYRWVLRSPFLNKC